MALNLRAPFLCTQHAAKLMRTAKRSGTETGLIVNIADLSGMFAWSEFSVHGISKAGIIHLTTISARLLAPDIRVNCIAPGAVMPGPDQPRSDPDFLKIGERLPLQQVGHEDNVAQTVVFYATNDFVTGEVLTVDGGEHLLGPYGH
jgi:NAD(P)-dependent dehydrogenase (short-subunit alcohol dehydrogenase family)